MGPTLFEQPTPAEQINPPNQEITIPNQELNYHIITINE